MKKDPVLAHHSWSIKNTVFITSFFHISPYFLFTFKTISVQAFCAFDVPFFMKCYTIYTKTYLRSVLEHAVDMVVLYSSVSVRAAPFNPITLCIKGVRLLNQLWPFFKKNTGFGALKVVKQLTHTNLKDQTCHLAESSVKFL